MTKMPDGEKTKFDIQKYHISFTTLIMGRMMKMTGEIFVVGEGGHYAVKSEARSFEMVMSVSLKNSEW